MSLNLKYVKPISTMNNTKLFWLRHITLCFITATFTIKFDTDWQFILSCWSCCALNSAICCYIDTLEGELYGE